MNITIESIKNLKTIVANSNALKVGLASNGKKSAVTVANWILNGELGHLNQTISCGSREFAQEILEAVNPIIEEAIKIGWDMDGLPDSTVYQAQALLNVATTIEDIADRRIKEKN